MIYDVIAMLEVTNQKTTGTVQSLSQPQQGTAPSAAAFPQHNPRSTGSFQAPAQTSQSVNKGIVGSSGASGTFSTSGTYSTQPPQPQTPPAQSGVGWKSVDNNNWNASDTGWKAAEPTPSNQHGLSSTNYNAVNPAAGAQSIQQAMANLAAGNPIPNTPPLPTSQSLLKPSAPQVPAGMSPQQALAAQQGAAQQYMPEGSLPSDFLVTLQQQ
ncbi:MAG: hypothetical protein IPP97_28840 [Candidatus Obscuribacter sp.]|nr:hypothetical protein [Candidatus Obscuribacter sp.]